MMGQRRAALSGNGQFVRDTNIVFGIRNTLRAADSA